MEAIKTLLKDVLLTAAQLISLFIGSHIFFTFLATFRWSKRPGYNVLIDDILIPYLRNTFPGVKKAVEFHLEDLGKFHWDVVDNIMEYVEFSIIPHYEIYTEKYCVAFGLLFFLLLVSHFNKSVLKFIKPNTFMARAVKKITNFDNSFKIYFEFTFEIIWSYLHVYMIVFGAYHNFEIFIWMLFVWIWAWLNLDVGLWFLTRNDAPAERTQAYFKLYELNDRWCVIPHGRMFWLRCMLAATLWNTI